MMHLVLLAVVGLSVIIFIGVMVEGLSMLSSKSRQLVDLKVKSATVNAQLSNLVQTKKDVEKYSFFKSVAQTVIPSDKDQAEAVLELNQMAAQAGIVLQSIAFPASNLGTSAAATSTTTTPSTTSTSNIISQAKPVQGIPGLYSLQLTITVDSSSTLPAVQQATYAKMLDFLNRLENNRRTAQITQVLVQPATDTTAFSFSLETNVFIKP